MSDAGQAGVADCAEIYYAPSDVFERRRDGAFWLPYIVFFLAFAGLFFATRGLMAPLYDAEAGQAIAKAMAKNPSMTAEQAEQMRGAVRGFAAVGALVTPLIMPFIVGIITWLLAKLVTGGVGLKQGIMIGTFVLYPLLIQLIAFAVQAALMPDSLTSRGALSIGPARFMDTSQGGALAGVLTQIDLFALWSAFLMGLGVKVIGRTTTQQAVVVGAVGWLIGAILAALAGMGAAAA